MANIKDLLLATSLFNYIIERGGQVVFSHFVPGKLPILVLLRVECAVPAAVMVAAVVAQPDVIAELSQAEGQGPVVRSSDQPRVRAVNQAVLEEDNSALAGDSS